MTSIKDRIKRKWKGEKWCVQSGCANQTTGGPIRTMSGYVYACSKHKMAAGGRKPKNVIAAAQQAQERKLKAEQRRHERS